MYVPSLSVSGGVSEVWRTGTIVPEEEVGYVSAEVELCVGGDGLISHELQELRSFLHRVIMI